MNAAKMGWRLLGGQERARGKPPLARSALTLGCAAALAMMSGLAAVPRTAAQIPRDTRSNPAVDRSTPYEAHDRAARALWRDPSAPECARGHHRTAADVTTSGTGACRKPRRAHRVQEDDHVGLLLAPLLTHEFLRISDGGSWGRSPRHILRQDASHFRSLQLETDDHFYALLNRSIALEDGGRREALRLHRDVHLVKGRGSRRDVYGANVSSKAKSSALTSEEATGAVHAGYAATLSHVDARSGPIARFVHGVEEEFGIPMRAHVQVTRAQNASAKTLPLSQVARACTVDAAFHRCRRRVCRTANRCRGGGGL